MPQRLSIYPPLLRTRSYLEVLTQDLSCCKIRFPDSNSVKKTVKVQVDFFNFSDNPVSRFQITASLGNSCSFPLSYPAKKVLISLDGKSIGFFNIPKQASLLLLSYRPKEGLKQVSAMSKLILV